MNGRSGTSPFKITGSELNRSITNRFLVSSNVCTVDTVSTRAPVSAWRFAKRSSSAMEAGSGLTRNLALERRFTSYCQQYRSGMKDNCQIVIAEDNPADVMVVRMALEKSVSDFELKVFQDGGSMLELPRRIGAVWRAVSGMSCCWT